jgi:hypothetical protein
MSHGGGFVPRRFVLGEFAEPGDMLSATKKMREKGHKKLDTHSPYPLDGIEDALGLGRAKIPLIVLCGALIGACLAYSMIYFMNAVDFPINVANRPPHSPPTHIPITFELAVLFGGGSSFFGLMALMRLPEPYHPVFEAESFRRASIDAFFVSIEVPEGQNPSDVAAELRDLGPVDVQIVEESER